MLRNSNKIILLSIFVLFFAPNIYALPISGGTSGVFVNPTGPTGMIANGVGTNSFSWGDAGNWGVGQSSLNFVGNSFVGATDEVFSFGNLSYFNGTIAENTQADAVDLNVSLSLTSPVGIEAEFLYNLGLINTPNTGDPNASADTVYLPNTAPDSFFTTGGVNYTLEFIGFGNITGSGFTTVDYFHVLEGSRASAELLGRITEVAPVPEPSTILLMGAGLLGLVGYNRKRFSNKS